MTVSLVTPAATAGPGARGRGTTSGDSSSAEGFGLVMAKQLAGPAEKGDAGRTGKAGTSAATGENAQASEASDGGAEGGSTEVLPHLVLVGTPAGLTTPLGGPGAGNASSETSAGTEQQDEADGLAGDAASLAAAVLHGPAVPATAAPLGEGTQQNATGTPGSPASTAAVAAAASTAAAGAAAAATGQPAAEAASNGAAQSADGEAATGTPNAGAPAAGSTGTGASGAAGAPRGEAGSASAATGTPIPAGMDPTTSSGATSTAASEQPAPTAGVGATTSGATPTAPTAAAPTNGSAVTSQVFPTIPALVSRGEGMHSMTLRLHPADLGEVHVTVTVKNGVVDVTLLAGREAQEAIRSGSHELRSILDLAGGATGQLTIRDLPTGPTPLGSSSASAFSLASSSADNHGEPSGSTGEGSADDRPNGREARGTADGDQAPSESTDPRNARSAAGLDLTL
jgi:flagellar hook-length control protein FliK